MKYKIKLEKSSARLLSRLLLPVALCFLYIALQLELGGNIAYLIEATPMMVEHGMMSLALSVGGCLLYDLLLKRNT